MISNFTCNVESLGRGKVIVARWTEDGVEKNVSTLASASTVEAFSREVQQGLGLLSYPADTAFIRAVKQGNCERLTYHGKAIAHEEPYYYRSIH